MVNINEVDFARAEKIPPALAGIMLDWSFGAREVTATLADLVVRDILFVQGETIAKNPGKYASLHTFEKKFLDEIFGTATDLKFPQLSSRISERYDSILRIIAQGMVELGYFRPDYVQRIATISKDYAHGWLAYYGVSAPPPKISATAIPVPPVVSQFLDKYSGIAAVACGSAILFILAVMFIVGISSPSGTQNGFMAFTASLASTCLLLPLFGLFFMFLCIAALSHSIHNFVRNTVRSADPFASSIYDILLSDSGRQAQATARQLHNFMLGAPMIEDRLANELVQYAIGFGIGKIWLKRFFGKNAPMALLWESIEGEAGFSSRAYNMADFMRAYDEA